jgi:peroxiredoxin Q/BCP
MLKAGDKAPEFVLENDKGEEISLSDLLKNGPLILYFYPADFTPGCTAEACSIRDIHSDIQSVGLQVAGVSPQDADSHARFREKHDLPFELLCDPDKVAAKSYDVDGPFGVGVRRTTSSRLTCALVAMKSSSRTLSSCGKAPTDYSPRMVTITVRRWPRCLCSQR